MFKLSKQDKIHIFKEWTLEEKRGTYLGKKYGVRKEIINYLVKLIKIHGFSILDKPHTYYSKEYKERAIFGDETIAAVALDLGLSSIGMLSNWIRSYKENGYNVVIKKKGRYTLEEKNKQRAREAETRKRKASSPEFKAYCRKRIYKKIGCLGAELKGRYTAPGYRVVADRLHNEGFKVNRKTVYRLMSKLNLIGYRMRRRKRYDSYEGEIEGRIKPDLIKHKFFAVRPNMKWYEDVTEFNLRGHKLYLSPIIDGCARNIVAYNISRHPNLKQVMTMLDDAFTAHPALNGLIFHSDRGWQYQNRAYQRELAIHGIEQSMSRKGCSPDDGL